MTFDLLLAQTSLGPRQVVPVIVLVGVAALVWLIMMLVNRGEGRTDKRLAEIAKAGQPGTGNAKESAGADRFQELLQKAATTASKPLQPTSDDEQSELKMRMAHAGWRADNAVSVYLGIKFSFLIIGIVVALLTVIPAYGWTMNGYMYSFLVAGLMFYLPGLFVNFAVKARQEQIFMGLPDALDLMVVCVESGLGLDAAMRKVCEEMGRTFPIISEEFSICNFQLQMGRPRRDVLHDLGARTGVDDMKALAAILIQADRFGSSIAQALRVQSDAMRVRRRQTAEERAAKTAVQLIFPLVLFIFPAIFIVLVGPAALSIADSLGTMK